MKAKVKLSSEEYWEYVSTYSDDINTGIYLKRG
jgi:hypothetical protein